jgi:hypothetical protein
VANAFDDNFIYRVTISSIIMKRGRGHQSRNKRRQSKHNKHTRRHHKKQQGGFGPGARPVGYAWTPDAATWPGVLAANGGETQGIAMSNYLPLSPNGIAVGGVDIAVPEVGFKGGSRKSRKSHKSHKKHGSRKGGRRHKKAKTHKKRRYYGGFGPQELINFGRDLKYKAIGAYDTFMGNEQPVNPSPLDQPINENYKVVEPTPINLPRAFSLAGNSVAPL